MNHLSRLLSLFAASSLGAMATSATAQNWPRFRGPNGSGISPENRSLPTEWDDTKNIAWKIELPGAGSATPVVWDDRVYVTSFSGYHVPEGHGKRPKTGSLVRYLQCFDARTGRELWRKSRPADQSPEEAPEGHGFATPTPAVDASGVYAYFGPDGLVAYDHDGEERWTKDCGRQLHPEGSTSSPVLFEDIVFIQASHESWTLFALDKSTGEEIWKTRSPSENSTPMISTANDRPELLVNAGALPAYDPRTGEVLWTAQTQGIGHNSSPTLADGVIFTLGTSGVALKADGSSNVLWRPDRLSGGIMSPLFHDGHIYWIREWTAYCYDAGSGNLASEIMLPDPTGDIYASPVTGDGKIYYATREAGVYVLSLAPNQRVLAVNRFQDDRTVVNANPAISGGRLYLRTDRALYCIGE